MSEGAPGSREQFDLFWDGDTERQLILNEDEDLPVIAEAIGFDSEAPALLLTATA